MGGDRYGNDFAPGSIKQLRRLPFYPHLFHPAKLVTDSFQGGYFLSKALLQLCFFVDPRTFQVHHKHGSKRFEGQRAWREVADPER
jgi:hypothetical protein